MNSQSERLSPEELAAEIAAKIRALSEQTTPEVRAVRRTYTRQLKEENAVYVLSTARELNSSYGHRWIAYELVAAHPDAFRSLTVADLEEFGQGMDSWSAVDTFARTLSGPAWRDGLVDDDLIHRWARSEDRWWRRAALVSTAALNVRSHGGTGDVARTLEVCRMLAADHDDMVVKALSWALRELVVHDPEAVQAFLTEHEDVVAARVKREVTNKLRTGLKNPRG